MEHTFTVRAEMMWASRNNPKLIQEVRDEFANLEASGIHIRHAQYAPEYFVVTVGTQDSQYYKVLNERMKASAEYVHSLSSTTASSKCREIKKTI